MHPPVTSFVGVWIETQGSAKATQLYESHPSWVCGLKQHFVCCAHGGHESHPSWVCGLKQVNLSKLNDDFIVTSFVGVWIETEYCQATKD